jgi:hypothetical protein
MMLGSNSNSSSKSGAPGSARPATIIYSLALIFMMGALPALADKLVLFKNGKVMRVKSVDTKDGWTRMKIGKKNIMAVRSSYILAVEEAAAAGKNSVGSSLPNQATVGGRGGGTGRARAGNNPRANRERTPQPQAQAKAQDNREAPEEALEEIPPNLKRGFARNSQRNTRGARNQGTQPGAGGFNRFRNGRATSATNNGKQPSRLDRRLEENAKKAREQQQNSGDGEDDD